MGQPPRARGGVGPRLTAKKEAGAVAATLPAISGKHEDILQSEAGKVAIMDRAVQRGQGSATKNFQSAAWASLTKHQVTTIAALAQYEVEIIPSLKNRSDVLNRSDLTQPPAVK